MPGILDFLTKREAAREPSAQERKVEDVRNRAEGAWAALYGTDPKMKGVTLNEMGPLSRLWYGGQNVAARHSSLLPWQNDIYYDPKQIAAYDMNPVETIEHEAEHVRQRQNMGYLDWMKALFAEGKKEYGSGPLEGGAMVAENNVFKKMQGRDVTLPPEGSMRSDLDRRLRSTK